jgi:hypothetical protein
MEDRARDNDLTAAAAIWPQLQAELDRLSPAMAEFTRASTTGSACPLATTPARAVTTASGSGRSVRA